MSRNLISFIAPVSFFLFCLVIPASSENLPGRDEERIVYQYGFEDGWNGWDRDDPWEISDQESHNGDFSAHCPIEENLNASLITPEMEIPGDDWHTHFEFWVRADTREYDADGDNMLDDYFRLQISVNNGGWEDVIYDYGRDEEWQLNWVYYGPGVWFRNDMPRWRVQLDLTQFAGEEVELMWLFRTDGFMDGDQGTGLWIDDFCLIATDDRENDVGMEWIHLDYPTSLGVGLSGEMQVVNFGYADQERIRKFISAGGNRNIPVVPWDGLEAYTSRIYELSRFPVDYLVQTGMTEVKAFAYTDNDENISNDTAYADILIYPENICKLGYDDRQCRNDIVDNNGGPAVLFTPGADGIEGAFDLCGVEVLWSNAQQDEEVTTTITVSRDQDAEPGDELYSAEIEVTPAMLFPLFQYIDLSGIEQLEGLEQDFWISFTTDREDRLPHIMGRIIEEDDPYWGEGHYYSYNGEAVREVDMEYQLHAVIALGERDEVNLVVQPDLSLGEVAIDGSKTMSLIAFGAGSEPVVIEDFNIDSDLFRVELDGDLPLGLSIGETAVFNVGFFPEDEGEFEAELTFNCNDESPPTVSIIGTGSLLPAIEVIPAEINFGEIELDEVSERVFSILNLGLADLVVSDIITEGGYFEVEFDEELVIDPGDDRDVFASFCPLEVGRYEGEIVISCNDPNNPAPSISVTGFGIGDGYPVVDRPIGDLSLDEDFEPIDVADLDDVFLDLEGDEMTFSVESDDDNLRVELDEDNHLWLSVEPDWFGDAAVSVFADDHSGEEVMVEQVQDQALEVFCSVAGYEELVQLQHPVFEDRLPRRDFVTEHAFSVRVLPVNDAPGSFNLQLPEDGFRVERPDYQTDFEWETALDVDDDQITYNLSFQIQHDGIDTVVCYYRIEETGRVVHLDQMLLAVGIYAGDEDTSLVMEWWVEADDGAVTTESDQRWNLIVPEPSSIPLARKGIPREFSLDCAFPNPFNAVTNIPFAVPAKSRVTIRIHDLSGGLIRTLCDDVKPAGRYTISWDGRSIPAGIYLVSMESHAFQAVQKLVLVR